MKQFPAHIGTLILILVCLICYWYLGYEINRSNFPLLFSGFLIGFCASFLLIRKPKQLSLKQGQFLGLAFRLVFFFSIPLLSDDYFRFIWDGQLLHLGLNPFDELPSQVAAEFPNKEILMQSMNSLNYYTIYPPIAQLAYYLGVWISPDTIQGPILGMRSLILLSEATIIWVLPKLMRELKLNPRRSLWYTLNPLIILELSGNLHMESFMIAFFTLAFYALIRNRFFQSALFWALAAASKLIPLLLVPLFFRYLGWRRFFVFGAVILLLFCASWMPLYSEFMVPHFLESFNLYFKSFEFNGSIYYILSWLGEQFIGYNPIQTLGTILPKLVLLLVLFLLFRKRNKDLLQAIQSAFFALCVYYLFASIVHPWYVCTVLFFGLLTRFSFPILWSFTAVLSYAAYQSETYTENTLLIAIEYALVFALAIWELLNKAQLPILDPKSAT